MNMKSIIKDALILCLITIIAGGCLGLVYEITKDPIAQAKEDAKQKAYSEVFVGAEVSAFNKVEAVSVDDMNSWITAAGIEKDLVNEVMIAVDGSNKTVGAAFNMTAKDGFGGNIQIVVGIMKDGKINKISILSISETPGLGMKATEDSFKNQFDGKPASELKVVKTDAAADTDVQAISGATITSKAVTKCVNSAVVVFNKLVEGGVVGE